MRIEKTGTDKTTLTGLLVYPTYAEEINNPSINDDIKDLALGCILYYSKLQEEFKACSNPKALYDQYITQWHIDFDHIVIELKRYFYRERVNYMVSIIEQFIIDTITSEYDRSRVLC